MTTDPQSDGERWQHSVPLDRKYWADNPNYLTTIPPRISKYAQVSDDALIQLHIDMVGKRNIGVADGLLCRIGNFASVVYAEAPPEMVALIAYANEIAVFYDDFDVYGPDNDSIGLTSSSVLPTYYQNLDMEVEGPIWKARGKETLFKIFSLFSRADAALGKELFDQFNAWKASERNVQKRFDDYKDLQQYITDRSNDYGWPYVLVCMKLGTNIHLTKDEEAAIEHVFRPMKHQALLVNDLLSYDKELRQHEISGGKIPLINAVALLMRWSGQSAEDAKASLRETCLNLDSEYFTLKGEYFKKWKGNISPSSARWFDLFELAISGNNWWMIMSYRHSSSPDGSAYRAHYERRCKQGAVWADDCTESEDILVESIAPGLEEKRRPGQSQPLTNRSARRYKTQHPLSD
ncbi:isoprenoid synthase domain-containing protein [Aspergillus pseudodeflectus]|uniref:Isoprenoid synthase domain-containing protein n=1 Tax=Aspergillus pseudodeflectus TaxID=176178 RepID=A0ABR4L5M1_9EURO